MISFVSFSFLVVFSTFDTMFIKIYLTKMVFLTDLIIKHTHIYISYESLIHTNIWQQLLCILIVIIEKYDLNTVKIACILTCRYKPYLDYYDCVSGFKSTSRGFCLCNLLRVTALISHQLY